jgi:carbonic anhydrase
MRIRPRITLDICGPSPSGVSFIRSSRFTPRIETPVRGFGKRAVNRGIRPRLLPRFYLFGILTGGAAKATAEKQTPFACVLACIDSRSAPELVLDQQVGDIFVARVAGNVPPPEILGSFEYATKVAGAKAILVLGHNHCGAVKGAVDRADVGANLTTLLDEIEPAVAATPLEGERSSKNHEFVEAVAETNVRFAVKALTEKSAVLKEMVDAGTVKVVGGLYDIETGLVTLLS